MSRAQQDQALMAENLHLNRTAAQELQDGKMNTPLHEFRVFNIVIISLALCILTITGLYCIAACYNRTRQSKRAHIYESAVTCGEPVDPVAVKTVKQSACFINPLGFFKKPDSAKDNSSIYYIYSNPLPVGVKDEEEERHNLTSHRPKEQTELLLSLQDDANNPSSGIVLDPPIFYMQL